MATAATAAGTSSNPCAEGQTFDHPSFEAMLECGPDILLTFTEEGKGSIRTHKLMLALASSVFRDMLAVTEPVGHVAKKRAIEHAGSHALLEVPLSGDDPAAWMEVLKRIYPVYPPPPITFEVLISIAPIVVKYNFSSLLLRVQAYAASTLKLSLAQDSPYFVLNWLLVGDQLRLSMLVDKCLEYIKSNTSCVIRNSNCAHCGAVETSGHKAHNKGKTVCFSCGYAMPAPDALLLDAPSPCKNCWGCTITRYLMLAAAEGEVGTTVMERLRPQTMLELMRRLAGRQHA